MLRILLAASILCFCNAAFAGASDSIWSALVLASNEPKPNPPPPELARFAGRLGKVFGYNQFEIIGAHTELIDTPDEHWLLPSKRFSVCVQEKRSEAGTHLMTLKLYQEKKLLVETHA